MFYDRKEGKGGTESLQELTAGAKNQAGMLEHPFDLQEKMANQRFKG